MLLECWDESWIYCLCRNLNFIGGSEAVRRCKNIHGSVLVWTMNWTISKIDILWFFKTFLHKLKWWRSNDLKVLVWWNQRDNIICRKQELSPVVPKLPTQCNQWKLSSCPGRTVTAKLPLSEGPRPHTHGAWVYFSRWPPETLRNSTLWIFEWCLWFWKRSSESSHSFKRHEGSLNNSQKRALRHEVGAAACQSPHVCVFNFKIIHWKLKKSSK